MSFWRKLLGMADSERGSRPAWDDFWYGPAIGGANGVSVTSAKALSIAAVYACVRLISETVASLPLHVYRRQDDGGKSRATAHPVYRLLHLQPNPWQTAMELREMLCADLVLLGNAYAYIDWGRDGYPRALIPLHHSRVKCSARPDGYRVYEYRNPDNRIFIYQQDQVLHLRNWSNDGITGLSPLSRVASTLALTLQVESFGAKYFQNYARPGGALKLPAGKKLDPDAAKRLKEDFEAKYSGENAHRVAVFEDGLEWQSLGLSNEDAQFLDTRKFQTSEIARIFRVPLHMLADLDRATFSNIEHQELEFVVHTIRPWLVRIEQALNLALFTEIEQAEYFAEHQVEGLLRGDIKSRYEAYEIATNPQRGAWMTRNEVRLLENLNPLLGLDDPPVQVNPQAMGQNPGGTS